jgi:hypothetical protein
MLSKIFTTKCFGSKDKEKIDHYPELQNLSFKYNISVLPLFKSFNIDDLHPTTNNVENWITFIIGKDKRYIVANNINYLNINISQNEILNKIGKDGIFDFLNPLWDKTLQGRKLQFFMIYQNKTYFVNTYPYYNNVNIIIGASMFIRPFDTMPAICCRLSFDNNNSKNKKTN